MGRKSKEGTESDDGVVSIPSPANLDKMRKMRDSFLSIAKTDTGNILKSSPFSNVREWIPTGSYALNALISGSLYKGIPSGRMVGLGGLNSVGKSYLTGTICREAQQMGYFPIYIDTENAVDDAFLSRIGVNTEMLYHDNMFIIEDIRNYIINKVGEALSKNSDMKAIICIDSLGNLSSNKDKEDVKKDKNNMDMGCFIRGTLVKIITPSGNVDKPIEMVKIGDVVLTHLGNKKPVKNVFNYTNKIKKIKFTVGGKDIIVTPEHKLLVLSNGVYLWKQAKDILKTDKLVKIRQ